MENFKKAVAKLFIPGTIISQNFDESSAKQPFVCIVNRVWWYKVRFFVQLDTRIDACGVYLITESQHWTLEGANGKVAELTANMKHSPPLLPWSKVVATYDMELVCYRDCHLSNDPEDVMYKNLIFKPLPDDCKHYPDKYLKAGDHILIKRNGRLYHHSGIYGGGYKCNVFHIPSGNRMEKRVQETEWKNFLGTDQGVISIVFYLIRYRSPDDIVKKAREFCQQLYDIQQFHLFGDNCQHFACVCATGIKFSGESNWITEHERLLT